MSEAPRKRSRFDKTESEVKRSRFDQPDPRRRRSRSPGSRDHGSSRRSRSPASRGNDISATASPEPGKANALSSAAEKAKAAAARINAEMQAKKAAGLLPTTQTPKLTSVKSDSAEAGDKKSKDNDIYEQDGDFIKDIEVNDLRNRYTLTKGAFQKEIGDKTGADVTTRGAYYPDKAMATAANPPLYLHITSRTKEGLEAAIAIIDDMMQKDLPNLIDERRFPRNRREPEVERDERGRRKWPDEKIPIRLEPINGFNLRAQVVGQQGMYVKHIQQESGARVQIKGRGSGFYEHDTGVESDEPMYLHVTAPQQEQVNQAKELCMSLLENVEKEYNDFKERGGHRRGGFGGRDGGGGGGYGNRDGGYNNRDGGYNNNRDGGYNNRGNDNYGSYGGGQQYGAYSQYGGAQSPATPYNAQAGGAQSPGTGADQSGAADPYTSYLQYKGWEASDPAGFNAYMQSSPGWYQWYQQYKQMYDPAGTAAAQPYGAYAGYTGYESAPGYEAPQGGAGGSAPPPPPPSDNDAPPPPPGTGGGSGGYNSVPPPPGL